MSASVKPSARYASDVSRLRSSKYSTGIRRGSNTPEDPAAGRALRDQTERLPHAAATITAPTTPRVTPDRIPSQRRGAGTGRVIRRIGPVAADGFCNASANSAVVGNRSAGVLARARRIASSTASGIVVRTIDGGDTMSSEWRAMIACAVGPEKGGAPTSISYVTHARLYWPLRPSISLLSVAGSGLLSDRVPTTAPA